MSAGKKPIEGLTIRLWDPPTASTTGENKGSRGFRQYTEEVGSKELKYTTHDWDTDKKNEKKTTTKDGLQQSGRDWDAEKKKLESVKNLPPLSRSGGQEGVHQSLRKIQFQHDLWLEIMKKCESLKGVQDKSKWEPVVDLCRKLREGVYASNWSDGDFAFATRVFQESVNSSIRAHNYGELMKSIYGLRDLYKLNGDSEHPYYTLIDILFHACYIRNTKEIMNRATKLDPSTNEGRFGRQFVKCILVTEDPIRYFKLYHNNPYPSFKILMDNYNDTMRIKAIDVLRKAYLSAPIEWVGIWLGIKGNSVKVLSEIDRLVKPTCIKSIDADRQVVYFLKKKK